MRQSNHNGPSFVLEWSWATLVPVRSCSEIPLHLLSLLRHLLTIDDEVEQQIPALLAPPSTGFLFMLCLFF